MALIEYVDREGELRPPKPPEGLSVSWAAREFVNKQMEERRTTDKRERTRVHGREEVLAAEEVMSADAAAPTV